MAGTRVASAYYLDEVLPQLGAHSVQDAIDALKGLVGQPTATSLRVQKLASSALSGHRVVKFTGATGAAYVDPTVLADAHLAAGLTLGAAAPGDAIQVLVTGEIEETSWVWTPGQLIFVGAAGSLVSAVGVGFAWSQIVGVATSPTTIFVQPRGPIVLG